MQTFLAPLPGENHTIVFHYSEIGLKAGNRKQFEIQLQKNLKRALKGLVETRIRRLFGRYLMPVPTDADWNAIRERLVQVVGLSDFSFAVEVEQDLERISEVAVNLMKSIEFESFRVTVRRAQKAFPHKSDDIAREVGAAIQVATNSRVDLTNPQSTCFVEIFEDVALVYSEKIQGTRGLPVGSNERAVSLLSSGIDSPVASWRVLTRGVKLSYVHFHSAPYTSETSITNTKRLLQKLAEYQYSAKLHIIPFIEIQQAIKLGAPAEYLVILYRRSMFRIAELVAKRDRASALVTGESVGQVASQTLSNMRMINEVSTLPVLRPLSGSDKEEIVTLARKIGTFDISIEPYDDCCSLFVPRHPVTKAIPKIVHEAEAGLNLEPLEQAALEAAEIHYAKFPVTKS